MKGYFVFFDEEKNSCLVLDTTPEQIDIFDANSTGTVDLDKMKNFKFAKPIKITVSPLNHKAEANMSEITLIREFIGGIMLPNGMITPRKYIETQKEYLKREKEFIKKTIKRG